MVVEERRWRMGRVVLDIPSERILVGMKVENVDQARRVSFMFW